MTANGAGYRRGGRARSLRAGAGLLVGGWLVALALPAAAATVTVPAGTRVPLQIDQRLDSRRTRPGERVRLRARSAVTVRGHRVIARGARAEAYVDRVRQPGRYGRRGEIRLHRIYVQAVDGRRIPLTAYHSGRRHSNPAAHGATAGGFLVFGPLGLAAGALVRGHHLVIQPGTDIASEVERAVTVRTRR